MRLWETIDYQRAIDRGMSPQQAREFVRSEAAMRESRRRNWPQALRDAVADHPERGRVIDVQAVDTKLFDE